MGELRIISNIFYNYYIILYYYTPPLSIHPSIHPSIPQGGGWKNKKNGIINNRCILYQLDAITALFCYSRVWNNVGNSKKKNKWLIWLKESMINIVRKR
jgi:hypothetical protein